MSEWIPVTERLPDSWASVFVLINGTAPSIGCHDDTDEWAWDHLDDHSESSEVTHWMQIALPLPPGAPDAS